MKISPRDHRDPATVNPDDPRDVRYWTEKFGCTEEQLKKASRKVGPNWQAVRAELGRRVPLTQERTAGSPLRTA